MHTKKSGHFRSKIFPLNFCLWPVMCKKNFIPISIGSCVIALQSYRQILKKYKKGNNSPQNIFFKFEKPFLDIHKRNVMPKFESSRLNGVAVIAKTYTHTNTHTYCRTWVIPKKNFFRGDWKALQGQFCHLPNYCNCYAKDDKSMCLTI